MSTTVQEQQDDSAKAPPRRPAKLALSLGAGYVLAALGGFAAFSVYFVGETICDTFDASTYDLVNSPGSGEIDAWALELRLFFAVAFVGLVATVIGYLKNPANQAMGIGGSVLRLLIPFVLASGAIRLFTNVTDRYLDDCASAVSLNPITVAVMALAPLSMAVLAYRVGAGRSVS